MRNFAALFLITTIALLPACASQLMKNAPNQAIPSLESNKSRIVFMRSAAHGTVVRAGIYKIVNEKPQFLGVMANNNKFFVDLEPGTHNFMSVSGTGFRFLSGDLKAGKTYFIATAPRGWPAINFPLYPFRGDNEGKFLLNSSDYTSMLADTVLVVPSPDSKQWADNERERVNIGFKLEWPLWNNKSSSFKAAFTIRSSDGV